MDHSRYRWVIVAAGGTLGCVAIGAMFSLPVLLQPIVRDTGWSVAGVSSAMTIGFLAMACCSMAWGTLSDRWGARPVVVTGSAVLAGSVAVASQAARSLALAAGNAAPPQSGGPQAEMSVGEAVRSPQFAILLLTNFFCCATHSGPIIHTVSYAVSCGIPLIAAVSIYSLEGFAGLGGRIAF